MNGVEAADPARRRVAIQRRSAHLAIARHVFGLARRGAAIWGVVFGVWVISTVEAFLKGYPRLDERVALARSLQSFATLLGTPHEAQTVAGFTSWRVLTAIAVIGAIWGIQTSTSLLRGEEEAGRWELLLAGPTTPRRATLEALLGFMAALLTMFVPTFLLVLAAGNLPGVRFSTLGSLLFALALVSGAAMFLAIGALASQLSATRGQASTIASAVLAISYVVRIIGDSRNSLGWLRWLSPLGWLEELRPLRNAEPLAFAPILGLVLVCAVLTVFLAGRRDLNGSVLREDSRRTGDGRWLRGPVSLMIHESRTSALAWLGGIAGVALVFGSLSRASTSVLTSSPAITATLGRLGARKATEGYLGVIVLMAMVVIALIAAGQVAGLRDEEASGRLDNLLVRPVSRLGWLVGRLGVAASLVVLGGLAFGYFTYLGMASQHLYFALPTLLEAGANIMPPGVFVLGAGTLVFGVHPRLSAVAAYGIVAWSFLVDLLGSLVKGSTWLRDSSLFTHVALAPAAKPDWGADAIIVLLGVAAALIGIIAFLRRDIAYA